MKDLSPKTQVFLVHFAGGNVYSFQFMKEHFRGYDFIPIELPGRGNRINEHILNDFIDAAKDLYLQILAKLNSSSFLLYGHSMGALLVLRIAHLLELDGHFPEAIVVSGNAGPGVFSSKSRHLLPDDEFKNELKRLGGMPNEVLDNKELYQFVEPIIRADFEVVETCHLMKKLNPISIPIYALMGDSESKVDKIENWRAYTLSTFKYQVLQGDHFFIYKHPLALSNVIKKAIRDN
ncbi:surfactin synthase thioesterase subunit [Pedobacter cryoconitis]|uniref:Surfactin synthase thioesterase subunit n=1 Tax=Pedobacter cryoconitis TaxID=188932 RepID=A0A7W9E0X9_9SPHI|nr:alpha/beta fold hydrolase [Pedobacter cryoconitis]MBB5638902.1 surfactin synthase thioesterase subunit [Pedobacter cryoconitis]